MIIIGKETLSSLSLREEQINKSLEKVKHKYKHKIKDPMSLPLKKEEKFELEKILEQKYQARRVNVSQEIPWIVQLQKEGRTKGFVKFE